MNPYHLKNILNKNGCESWVIPGYYGKSRKLSHNMVKSFLNFMISSNKKIGLKISPFYSIRGFKK